MKVGVARQHHAHVRVVLGQHVGTGADRIPIQRDVVLLHAGLAVQGLDLPGHGREERHRQPILKLRIAPVDADAIAVAIDHLGPVERDLPQVEEGSLAVDGVRCLFAEALGQCLETDDVLAHEPGDGRVQPGRGKALDLVDVVLGGELAGAGLGQVGELVQARRALATEIMVEVAAVGVLGQRPDAAGSGCRAECGPDTR
jgi:hypothetical protein